MTSATSAPLSAGILSVVELGFLRLSPVLARAERCFYVKIKLES
ncbi:hypothetical protein ACVST0_09345 [Yersinia enterocolitica]